MRDLMPIPASNWAESVDFANDLITYISIYCIFAITAVMLFFAYKYRRKRDASGNLEEPKTTYIVHNSALETVWTVIPSLVCLFVFWYGFIVYKEMRTPPTSATEIYVDAWKWRWDFQHPGGRKESGKLVVPLGRPVRLIMTSNDVLHSFFVPALRVKEDVIPEVYSYVWFTATRLGEYHIFCTEYCGLNHSGMLARLHVVSQEEYDDYILDRTSGNAPELSPEDLGKKLFVSKACNSCHSLDGSVVLGPTVKGLFETKTRALADGTRVDVDENYIKESILNPNVKIAQGFQPNLMPAFEGQLSDKEVTGLIAYLKTLK